MSREYTRGEFLGVGGALTAAFGIGNWPRILAGDTPPQKAVSGGRPDMILVNGNILTVDDGLPRAEAFAVRDGFFVAVGSNDDIRRVWRDLRQLDSTPRAGERGRGVGFTSR